MTKESLSTQWNDAIREWNQIRCADWTPDKAAKVEAARAKCSAARRAFYGFKES